MSASFVRVGIRVVLGVGVAGGVLGAILNVVAAKEPIEELVFALLVLASEVAFLSIGALIVARQPANRIGLLFMAIGGFLVVASITGGWAVYGLLKDPGSLPFTTAAAWIGRLVTPLGLALFIPAFLLFPDGRPPSPRWRPVLWAWCAALPVTMLGWMTGVPTIPVGDTETWSTTIANPTFAAASWDRVAVAAGSVLALTAIATLAALVLRFRRAHGDERQQIKWLMVVGVAFFIGFFVLQLVLAQVLSDPELNGAVGQILFLVYAAILLLGLPLATGVAILKYRLYDLDVVIRKTVIVAVVAVTLTGLYLAMVALATVAPISRLLVAAVLLVLTFRPVQRAARSIADRVAYGRRASSYEVLSEFSERIAETYADDDVLPRMATVLAAGTGAATATVWLRVGDEVRPAAAVGDRTPAGPAVLIGDELPDLGGEAVEIRHGGELLGALVVEMPPNDRLDHARRVLIQDMAAQAGLVLRNVRLIEELKASRQRLVAAQDEERRKIERNLHDGVQQQLIALNVQLGLLGTVAERDPAAVAGQAAALQGRATEALEDLRDLARGIYPPLLADKGLRSALEAQARKAVVATTVWAEGVGRFTPEVESTVYFSCLEALQNVAKYADATSVTIRLSEEGDGLGFRIRDDGRGFDTSRTGYGTGLQGMADRLDAVGGNLEISSEPGRGTSVIGRVPLDPPPLDR